MFNTLIRILLFLAGWATVVTCGLWNGLLRMNRLDQVNAHLPENERFEVLWWYPGKHQRFEQAYARIFPESKARIKERKLLVVGAIGLLLMMISLLPILG